MLTFLDNVTVNISEREETLNMFIIRLEQCIDQKKKNVTVEKEAFQILCSAAAMAYEVENWNKNTTDILEKICEIGSADMFPEEIKSRLKEWHSERTRERKQIEELERKLEQYENRENKA